ncbi:hypothetical protein E3C22_18025 [Jiella endophytica]|uniref:Uncharacterized protein n=1 Tax=Jiella endophytica TaxID=2558362 RepID=A0A4Y8RG29_9HYPH|nr:hypothetical protein [Jiella endophytica]TFF20788.1 hypothetical protein E3C22_18025 [Jiella endophytica]
MTARSSRRSTKGGTFRVHFIGGLVETVTAATAGAARKVAAKAAPKGSVISKVKRDRAGGAS